MTFLLTLVGLAVALILIYSLITVREAWDLDEEPDRLLHLKRTRDRILRKLKDIEVEHEEGSLLDEDYQVLRAAAKREAIEITREFNRVRQAAIRRVVARKPDTEISGEQLASLEARVASARKQLEASS